MQRDAVLCKILHQSLHLSPRQTPLLELICTSWLMQMSAPQSCYSIASLLKYLSAVIASSYADIFRVEWHCLWSFLGWLLWLWWPLSSGECLATWLFWLETIPSLVPLALHIISNEGERSVTIIKWAENTGVLSSWKACLAFLVQTSYLFSSWAPVTSYRTLLLAASGVNTWQETSCGTWGSS